VCGNWELTFKSLNVLDAENPTEMGKNDDGSAGGTTNSMEPLQGHKAKFTTQEVNLQNRMIIMGLTFKYFQPAIRLINKENRPFQHRVS